MSFFVSPRFVVTTLAFYCLWSQSAESSRSLTWQAVSEDTSVNLEGFREFQTDGIVMCSLKVSFVKPLPNMFCFGIGQCLYNSVILEETEGRQREGLACYNTSGDDITPGQHCPLQFTQSSFGCMLFDVAERDFNASVEYCQILGANLASLDTEKDFEDLRSTLTSEFGERNDFWVLVNCNDGVWTWGKNGRLVKPSPTGEWGADEPDGIPGGISVRIVGRNEFLLADSGPSRKYGVICHVWNV